MGQHAKKWVTQNGVGLDVVLEQIKKTSKS